MSLTCRDAAQMLFYSICEEFLVSLFYCLVYWLISLPKPKKKKKNFLLVVIFVNLSVIHTKVSREENVLDKSFQT